MSQRHIYHVMVERTVVLRERAKVELVSDSPVLSDEMILALAARKLTIADFTFMDVVSQTPLTVVDVVNTVDR